VSVPTAVLAYLLYNFLAISKMKEVCMRRFKLLLVLAIASAIMFSFPTIGKAKNDKTAPSFSAKTFPSDKYGPKIEAFAVLFDASGSMENRIDSHWFFFWRGTKELEVAKEFVSRMNKTLPELDYQGALRTFGHPSAVSKEKTALFFGLAQYSKTGFQKGLDTIKKPGGLTPMAEAIDAASKDLKSIEGQIAVIIISDGDRITNAVNAAKAMKEKYGERLCIYTVHVGNSPDGKAFMEELSQIGQCGFSVNASNTSSAAAMADFVEKVFLDKYIDSDGDGVYDHLDQCPGTPKGVKVDERGCPIPKPKPKPQPKPPLGPIDTDGDGVYDDKDRCKDTPKGARVDDRGCWVISDLRFDFEKADIKPEYHPTLDEVVSVMKMNPLMDILIEGHTDSVGSNEYNQSLSERRSQSVKKYFISKGIESQRMTAMGFGESRPIASNEAKEGRSKNRRVELTPKYKY
jgi:OOP family OmpA-OmpF porin